MKKTNALIILDGFALSDKTQGNAIVASGIKNISRLMQDYPSTELCASGYAVGLPDGYMGNSEVGHTNIGAGRVVYQYFSMINKSIEDGDFFTNPALLSAVNNAKSNDKKIHLLGLLSDGGVHSHIEHLFALLRLIKSHGLTEPYIHVFTDGRDTPAKEAIRYINQLESFIAAEKIGKIATVCGRYYGMDRDKNYDRIEAAYRLLTGGVGQRFPSALDAVKDYYKNDLTDEFLPPTLIAEGGEISEGDSVIFFNFRSDRAKQITAALTEPDFSAFAVSRLNLTYVCMTPYDDKLKNVSIAFYPQNLNNTLSEYLSHMGKTQLHIAETEKFAHVTKFFSANAEKQYQNEDWILIKSPAVATFDLKPEMSAYEITDTVVEKIAGGNYDAIIINYANCDMVGHTGNYEAAVKAVAVVDQCVGRVVSAILSSGGTAIITADHGNAECMIDESGDPVTTHTTNDVPFILVGERYKNAALRTGGKLADIAPTLLSVMNLPAPPEMSGKSLIK